jgi:hypothetical protein
MPSPVFTKENAVEMAQRANAAKAASRLLHAERLRMASNGEDFQQETLARTREILTDTLQRLASAKEPKDRELLARACSHLAEMERKLAGRPLPGTVNRSRAPDPAPRSTLPTPR